jgi:tRNA-dihydrouridine synthase
LVPTLPLRAACADTARVQPLLSSQLRCRDAAAAGNARVPLHLRSLAGPSEHKLTAARVVRLLHQAGAAAVVVHGRTTEQRYKKAADWGLLSQLVQQNRSTPIVGNGDILTHYEAADRWQAAKCTALMVGRGALIKPWCVRARMSACVVHVVRCARAWRDVLCCLLGGVRASLRACHCSRRHGGELAA